MKDIKLVERKPNERLVKLVDAIPELTIRENGRVEIEKGIMYQVKTGDICWTINGDRIIRNPLKNAHKLKEALNSGIKNVTEESFCDLLEQHLYLVAKEKMEELLPQIQEHLPDAKIIDNNDWLSINNKTIDVVVYSRFKVLSCSAFDDIWEDKENLIVKKPAPWWETQFDYYSFASNSLNVKTRFEPYKERIHQYNRRDISRNAGKTVFKTKEEAQAMCDKLNAVLKG